jgi:hypothetical protein
MVHTHCQLLPILRAALYLSLTLICVYFSTYTLSKYMEGEVIILSSGEEQDTFLFPSITFCRKFIFDEVWIYCIMCCPYISPI